ncbi:hypothetical protein [Flagellimonas crocea]|uniref:hypothetical protein n=1 Tax=Flagellimonas crocea TaxID=3067311 RepID=UPI00296E9F96|nr:hypothetical protein [Muricauda sp. DH64]
MEKKGDKENWKAKDSAPMETKQKNDIGVENQTTHSTKNRFPWLTIIAVLILIFIVTITMLMGS